MLYLKIPELISDYISTQSGNVCKISKEVCDEKNFILAYKTRSRHENRELAFRSIIPKIIPLNSQTLRVIGLLEAEMTKNGSKSSIVFTNSEPNLINEVLSWFGKYFGIKRNQCKWLIEFNKKLIISESCLDIKSRELSSIKFWVENCRIARENHFPKWCIYRGFDKGHIETENKWGTLIIVFGNMLMRKVMSDILKRFSGLIYKFSCKELSCYLDGLFCGDGGVSHSSKNPYVRRAFVSSYDEEVLSRAQRVLRRLNVDYYKSGNHDIFISDCRGMFRLYKLNFFRLHPEKWQIFLKILLSYKQFQGRARKIEVAFISKRNEMIKCVKETDKYLDRRKKEFKVIFNSFLKMATPNKMPIEVKLKGLALGPARLAIAREASAKPGITVRELVLKTELTQCSVEHCIFRLAKQGYVTKIHVKSKNMILIYPSPRLLEEIEDASLLRKQFVERYNISSDFHEPLFN